MAPTKVPAILWLLLVGGPALGAWYFYGPIFWTPYLLLGGLGAAAMAALAWATRPHGRDGVAVKRGALATFGLYAAGPWVLALGILLNALGDRSPAEEYASEYLGHAPSLWRNGQGSRIVRDFQADGGELHLSPRIAVRGGSIVRGDVLRLIVRRGLFGWTWIEAIVNDSALADLAAKP